MVRTGASNIVHRLSKGRDSSLAKVGALKQCSCDTVIFANSRKAKASIAPNDVHQHGDAAVHLLSAVRSSALITHKLL